MCSYLCDYDVLYSSMPNPIFYRNAEDAQDKSESKPVINVTPVIKSICSVYIEKGRLNATASHLIMTNKKCVRVAK